MEWVAKWFIVLSIVWSSHFFWMSVSRAADPSLLAELQFNISQDTMANSTTTAGQSSIYLGGIYLRMHPKAKVYLGAEAMSGSSIVKMDATTQAKASSQDVLLGVRYNFGKHEMFSVGAMYGVAAKVSYDLLSATSIEKWSGTSTMFRVGVTPNLRGSLSVLINLNYYSATYLKETSGDVVTRAMLFPTVGLSLEY
jgi:hypothetical protein